MVHSATLGGLLYALSASATPAMQEPAPRVLLAYKTQAGQVKRQASQGRVTVEAQGRKFVGEFRQVDRITYSKLGAGGEITLEDAA